MNRFIAIQTGARRNYAIPSILQEAGLLEAFYTDMCADAGLGALVDRFCPSTLRKGVVNRLLNRRLPNNLKHKVKTSDLSTIRYLHRNTKGSYGLGENRKSLNLFNQELSSSFIKVGLGKATHVFSMFGEGIGFLKFAKEKGRKVITEVYISPSTYKIIQEEKRRFPDLELPMEDSTFKYGYSHLQQMIRVTDEFIVPSNFVLKGLEELDINKNQCYKVPYAVDSSWLKVINKPTKGRILFVGTAELRKGIHILGLAAKKLSHLNYEFRVAGGVSDVMKKHKLTRQLNFLGRVPRGKIKQEFAQADIFVLPSLAEGSAEVTYEALAAGLPVITTEAAGSVIRDGIEGFIIPEKDPDVLAQKIEELIENRYLRNIKAIAAKERAKEYTWDKYSERLLSVLNS